MESASPLIPYDRLKKESIILYAKKLLNKSLGDFLDENTAVQFRGKGNFGQLVEEQFFHYKVNSVSEPDFKEVNLELKCSPLKKLKNGEFRSKERLVLNIINYLEIVKEDFHSSSFWRKNKNLLLIFYLYEKDKSVLEYLVKLVDEWSFPPEDLEIIKKDWSNIIDKIKEGKAHELSEGDTFYLGACTKGANSSSLREQPFSDVLAMQRAFSLKQGYVNHIIASIAGITVQGYGKIIKHVKEVRGSTLDELILSKFEKYKGKNIDDIISDAGIALNPSAKGFTANLTKALLGIELTKDIEEFQKAEIIVKTVRLKENLLPKEDMSFPYFKFTDLVVEEWENSKLNRILEHKFFLVFLNMKNGGLYFDKVIFWNMPYNDLLEVKRVWNHTVKVVKEGRIVARITDEQRKTNFPSKKFSSVSHVRPHARNSADTIPLPVRDRVTGDMQYTKHSFWLNSSYIRDEIYMKAD